MLELINTPPSLTCAVTLATAERVAGLTVDAVMITAGFAFLAMSLVHDMIFIGKTVSVPPTQFARRTFNRLMAINHTAGHADTPAVRANMRVNDN